MKKSNKNSVLKNDRLKKAVKRMDQFCKGIYEFPLLVKGKSGSGKTHFVTSYLNENNIDYVFLTVPDHKDYFEYVSESLQRHEAALKEHAEQAERLENSEYKKAVEKSSCPYVVIDESHQLGINPEDFQHEKKSYSFGGVEVPYSRLILISHASLGKNNSENNRLIKCVIPTPTREEIMETLIESGMKKDCALWSVTHSPCNFHSAIETSKDFGTELESTYNPRGLETDAIDCLAFYFHSDPAIRSIYSDQFVFPKVGTNTISNCIAYLGLDKKAIQESESILKEEGLLVTGEQSKRVIVSSEKSMTLTLAILKLSNKLEAIPEPEPEKPTQSKRNPASKAKPKDNKPKSNGKKATTSKSKTTSAKNNTKKPAKRSKTDGIKGVPVTLSEIKSQITVPANPLDKVGE